MLDRIPRPVVILLFAVIAAAIAMLVIGALTVGVTWDEKTHVLMLDTFFAQGWNVSPDALLPDGMPDPAYVWGVYVYGPVGELIAHAVAAGLGFEAWSGMDLPASAYVGRHLGIALMALVGVAAVGATVRVITGSWAWGLVGSAVLASIPLWIGHGMFNIKDTPVAVGYAMATLGIVALLRPGSLRTRRWPFALMLICLVLGTVLAAGTRAAIGVPILGGLVGAAVVLFLLTARSTSWRSAFLEAASRLLWGLASLVVAYLLLVAIYPKAFANPFVLAWQALVVSARFPFDEAVLTAGMWMEQPPPASYLPLWFGSQLPLLVVVGAVGALVWFIFAIIRCVVGRPGLMKMNQLAMTSAVALQLLLLPVLAIAMKSNMYNGSRQFLFIVPAAAVLATLGIWVLMRWIAQTWPTHRPPRAILWSVICVGVIAPVAISARLLPYNYTFFNAAASLAPIDGNWPSDYWRASGRELIQRVPATGPESCLYEQGDSAQLRPCSGEPMFKPFLNERGSKAGAAVLPEGGYWGIRENQGDTTTPEGCTLVDEVTRPLWWQTQVIGQIFACAR